MITEIEAAHPDWEPTMNNTKLISFIKKERRNLPKMTPPPGSIDQAVRLLLTRCLVSPEALDRDALVKIALSLLWCSKGSSLKRLEKDFSARFELDPDEVRSAVESLVTFAKSFMAERELPWDRTSLLSPETIKIFRDGADINTDTLGPECPIFSYPPDYPSADG